MNKGKVVLTGGHGMVGRNILENTRAAHWTFFSPSRAELDLCNFAAVEHYLKDVQPDFVIHAAGLVGGIQANTKRPVDFLVANIDIGRNIILASRATGVKKFINLASSCMYPRNATNPLAEDMILHGELEPTNEGYALAKIVATRLCQYISRETPELSYKTLIPCNLYGRFDKFDPQNSHLIPAIIHKIHQAKVQQLEHVEIWGDGAARREFMYAGDLADAILSGLERFESLPELMNVGLGHDYTIQEYYTACADIIGWQGQFVHNLSMPVGMKQKLVSVCKQTDWGWIPHTSLHDGIAKTYHYYRENYS